MAIQYTDDQLRTIKSLMEMCENFADQILHIMQNHGLDKVKGTKVLIDVEPQYHYVARTLEFGVMGDPDTGFVKLCKGLEDNRYVPTGKNSAEYECLFADEKTAERIRQVLQGKPLPPDGLWISSGDDGPAVDDRRDLM